MKRVSLSVEMFSQRASPDPNGVFYTSGTDYSAKMNDPLDDV